MAECPCEIDEIEGPAEGGIGCGAVTGRFESGHGGGLGGGEAGLGRGRCWSWAPLLKLLLAELAFPFSSAAGLLLLFLKGFTRLSALCAPFASIPAPFRGGPFPDASRDDDEEEEEAEGGVMGGVLAETDVAGEMDA